MLDAATAAFAALGLIWGSNFIFMKWASDALTAGQITFLRVLFGFLPVLVYALARGALSRAHLRYVHHFAVMSLLATSIYYFAFAKGTSLLPSGIAGALDGGGVLAMLVGLASVGRSFVYARRFLSGLAIPGRGLDDVPDGDCAGHASRHDRLSRDRRHPP